MIIPTTNKRPRRRLGPLLTALGTSICIFALLFAAANDSWVVISIPSAPWSNNPSFAAFEAKLWGIMLVCLILGAVFCGLVFYFMGKERRKKAAFANNRLKELENEIKNVGRLVATTRKGNQ